MEEIERLTRERDDAWEARDAWHARVAHIAQALGMPVPPSGDWRDVVFAEVEQAVASQRAELEAARAVVESWREAEPPFCRWQEAMHRDACAEAGRGLCSGCRTIAALARYDAAKAVE